MSRKNCQTVNKWIQDVDYKPSRILCFGAPLLTIIRNIHIINEEKGASLVAVIINDVFKEISNNENLKDKHFLRELFEGIP